VRANNATLQPTELEQLGLRQAKIVILRVFGGLTIEQVASARCVSNYRQARMGRGTNRVASGIGFGKYLKSSLKPSIGPMGPRRWMRPVHWLWHYPVVFNGSRSS